MENNPNTWLCFDRYGIEESYKAGIHCICCGTLMYRARVFEEMIGYRKNPGRLNDFVFLKSVIMHDYIIDNVADVLYFYRSHPGQKSISMQEEAYRNARMYQVKGRVSVILPIYGSAGQIFATLESILNQTYENMEIIIVDDLSDSATERAIKQFYCDYRGNHPECTVKEFLYFKLPRSVGYPWIYNIGAYLALGEYIMLHGNDGTSERHKVEKQAEFLKNNYEYVLVGTNTEPENESIKFDGDIECSYMQDYMPCIDINTVMLRTDIINMTGGFNQRTSGREDFEFIHMLIEESSKVQNLQEALYYTNSNYAAGGLSK